MRSPKPKFLIFGGHGLLGSEIVKLFELKSVSFLATTSKLDQVRDNFILFDLLSKINLFDFLKFIQPEIVINCIGITSIEFCELKKTESKLINHSFPIELSIVCSLLNIKFVNIGTDHFSTKLIKPRKETVNYFTVNYYSRLKMDAENEILKANSSALSIRTNFFANNRKRPNSFWNWYVNKLTNKTKFIGFDNVIFTPISAKILGLGVLELIHSEASGIINVCGNEELSKYNFGIMLGEILNCTTSHMKAGKIENNPNLVNRTNYLSLNNELFKSITNLQIPSLREMMIAELH